MVKLGIIVRNDWEKGEVKKNGRKGLDGLKRIEEGMCGDGFRQN